MFTVGLGRGASQKELQEKLGELADASGGLALFADNADKLTEPFAEIVETLANQYTLSFVPRRDGKYHELTGTGAGPRCPRARAARIRRPEITSRASSRADFLNSIVPARGMLTRWKGAVSP